MAKRQNFVVGSTNSVTQSMTTDELNHGFDQYEILTADELDGVFNAVSDFSNDSSNEIANAIQSITGAQPTGSSENELANALQQMRNEIETTSLTFKGYVATSEPSSSTYALVEGNLWINSATMPTSFPVAASSIKQWNGTSWVNYGSTYTPADFDFFRNINDNEGYYWFGGMWTVMSTDMSTTYFTLNQSTGKWEIKSSVNLPGSPTTTTPDAADQSTKIATTQFAHDFGQRYVTNCITEIPQDINLELSSGTLTLKAGSKVYVPNGSDVFDTLTIASDLSTTQTTDGVYLVAVTSAGTSITARLLANSASGAGATTTSGFAYDTTTNKINNYSSEGTIGAQYSFPVAIVTVSGGAISVIDQVFNGFGYIGSSRFFLPGVKVLIPNGLNSDGTLNNTPYTQTTVNVYTWSSSANTKNFCTLGEAIDNFTPYYEQTTQPATSGLWYNPKTNLLLRSTDSGATWVQRKAAVCAEVMLSSGTITSFSPKTAFHAVDYNDAAIKNADNVFTGLNTFENDTVVGGSLSAAADKIRMTTTSLGAKMVMAGQTPKILLGLDEDVGLQRGTDFMNRRYVQVSGDGLLLPSVAYTVSDAVAASRAFVKSHAMGLPDWANKIQITAPFTATENGYVVVWQTGGDVRGILYINDQAVDGASTPHAGSTGGNMAVAVGDVVTISTGTLYFIPCKQ